MKPPTAEQLMVFARDALSRPDNRWTLAQVNRALAKTQTAGGQTFSDLDSLSAYLVHQQQAIRAAGQGAPADAASVNPNGPLPPQSLPQTLRGAGEELMQGLTGGHGAAMEAAGKTAFSPESGTPLGAPSGGPTAFGSAISPSALLPRQPSRAPSSPEVTTTTANAEANRRLFGAHHPLLGMGLEGAGSALPFLATQGALEAVPAVPRLLAPPLAAGVVAGASGSGTAGQRLMRGAMAAGAFGVLDVGGRVVRLGANAMRSVPELASREAIARTAFAQSTEGIPKALADHLDALTGLGAHPEVAQAFADLRATTTHPIGGRIAAVENGVENVRKAVQKAVYGPLDEATQVTRSVNSKTGEIVPNSFKGGVKDTRIVDFLHGNADLTLPDGSHVHLLPEEQSAIQSAIPHDLRDASHRFNFSEVNGIRTKLLKKRDTRDLGRLLTDLMDKSPDLPGFEDARKTYKAVKDAQEGFLKGNSIFGHGSSKNRPEQIEQTLAQMPLAAQYTARLAGAAKFYDLMAKGEPLTLPKAETYLSHGWQSRIRVLLPEGEAGDARMRTIVEAMESGKEVALSKEMIESAKKQFREVLRDAVFAAGGFEAYHIFRGATAVSDGGVPR